MPDHNEKENPVTRRFRDKNKTRILSENFDFFRRKYETDEFAQLSNSNTERIALFIAGMKEYIDFEVTPIIILGRFPNQRAQNQIDLTDFGAVDRGVSRIHCQLEYRDGNIIVTDLKSTNGTFVAGKRLDPNQPCTMERGAEFIIGRLPIQIVSGH